MQVLGGVITAICGTGVVANVYAEELPQTEIKSVAEVSVTKQVTESDVKASQAVFDEVSTAVTSQETVVAEVKQEVTSAETNVGIAKIAVTEAENFVAQATPENVTKAEKAIAKAETGVQAAESNIESSQTEKTAAQAEVANQEKVVAAAQREVDSKQSEIVAVKSRVAEKQAILDGTGTKEIIAKAEQTQAKFEAEKQAVVDAQLELEKAKESDAKRASSLAQAEATVKSAQAEVDTTKAIFEDKMAKANDAQSVLATATTALKLANNDADSINTITLSPEYVTALKEYAQKIPTANESETKTMTDYLVALGKEHVKKNSFVSSPNDSHEANIDLNHLPRDIQQEMSLFASDLLNQVHQAFGTSKVEVTKDAVSIVNQHVLTSEKNGVRGHDRENLNKVLASYDIQSGTEENIGLMGGSHLGEMISKNDLKKLIYNNILNLMFGAFEDVEDDENSEFMHASSLSGLFTPEAKVSYLGVGSSYKANLWQIVNFLFIHDKAVVNSSSFDKTTLTNPFDSEKILVTQKTAQTTYNQVKSINDTAQLEKKTAKIAYDTATKFFEQVIRKRDSIKAIPILVLNAEQTLSARKATLKHSEIENEVAQSAVAQLNADVKAKQAALATAKAILSQKHEELRPLQARLSIEQVALQTRKDALVNAEKLVRQREAELKQVQSNLTQAKQYVSDLKNAPAKLAKAYDELESAQAMLADKKSKLETEVEKLKELQAKQAEVKAQYEKVVKAYQAYVEAQRKLEIERQRLEIEQAGGQAIPIVNVAGEIIGYRKVEQATIQTVSLSQATLPHTGDRASFLTVMGTVFLGLLGFAGRRKETK